MTRLAILAALSLAACAHAPVSCGPAFLFDDPPQLARTVTLDGHVIDLPDGALLSCELPLQ